MKYIVILFLIYFSSVSINAQSWISSNIITGSDDITIIQSAPGIDNSTIVMGYFLGTIETESGLELTSYGGRDYFVAKFNASNEIEWIKQFGSSINDFVGGGITVDIDNNIHVTGGYRNAALYYTATDFIENTGGFDIFYSKIDASGGILWCKNIGSGLSNQRPSSIIIDNEGNTLISGFFSDSIVFNESVTFYDTNTIPDYFFAKFDPNSGDLIWARHIHGINNSLSGQILNMSSSEDSYSMIGMFAGSVAFDSEDTLISDGSQYDIHLVNTDLLGNINWIRTIKGAGDEYIYTITSDPFGNLYLAGYYTSLSLIIDLNDTETTTVEGNHGGFDIFIAKFSSEGTFQWIKTNGGESTDKLFSIDYFNNEVHVTGLFSDTLRWGGIELITNGTNDQDMFYGSLDLDGNYRSANSYKGRNNSTEEGRSIFADEDRLSTVIRSNSDLLVLGSSIYTNPTMKYIVAVGTIGCLPISINASKLNVNSCFGDETGTIFIGASGGFGGPFRYSIDNGDSYQDNDPNFSSLAAGVYNTVVADKENCAQAGPIVTITQPEEIVITNVASDNVLCNGNNGSITVEGTGGTGSLFFSTDNGTSFPNAIGSTANLPAGNYDVVVKDANNCEVAGPAVEITQPDALVITEVAKTDLVCFEDEGGAINITAAGGTAPYNYSIDGGTTYQAEAAFSGLDAGTYNIKVTDENDCELTGDDVTITQPDELIVTVDNKTDLLCNGDDTGAITLSATGGTAPYQFSIDSLVTQGTENEFSGLKAGVYDVFVADDAGCTGTAGKTEITQPDTLKLMLISSADITSSANGSVVLEASGGTEPYTFTQLPEGISQATGTFTFAPGEAGVYSFELDDANNCGPVVKLVQINDLTNITEQMLKDGVIYPNPTTGQFTIEMNTEKPEMLMQVITIDGKVVLQKQLFSSGGKINETVDLSDQTKGIYMIRMDNKTLSSGVILQ